MVFLVVRPESNVSCCVTWEPSIRFSILQPSFRAARICAPRQFTEQTNPTSTQTTRSSAFLSTVWGSPRTPPVAGAAHAMAWSRADRARFGRAAMIRQGRRSEEDERPGQFTRNGATTRKLPLLGPHFSDPSHPRPPPPPGDGPCAGAIRLRKNARARERYPCYLCVCMTKRARSGVPSSWAGSTRALPTSSSSTD